jgi:single-strand DNA-binding protein
MTDLNRVFLAGNLTRDPEVRYIPSGTAVADLHMAINRRYKTATGEYKDDPCFVAVTAWGRQAETAKEYLKKGSAVLVEGSLRYHQWETNGEKRNALRVTADRIQFLDRGRRSAEGGGAAPARREEAPPPAAAEEPAAPEENKEEPAPDAKTDGDNLPF